MLCVALQHDASDIECAPHLGVRNISVHATSEILNFSSPVEIFRSAAQG